MSKINLAPLASGFRSSNKLNENLQAIETALENTLSRDGSAPNEMSAPLDMNSNPIINLPAPVDPTDVLRLVDVPNILDVAEAGAAAAAAIAASVVAQDAAEDAVAATIDKLDKTANLSDVANAETARGGLGVYATRAAAVAATIPTSLTTVTLAGYYAAGDKGGGLYVKAASEPAHGGKFQSANGTWYELSRAQTVTPWMFGATEEPWLTYLGTSSQAALQAFFDFISDYAVPKADVSGDFRTDGPVRFAPTSESGYIKTVNVVGLMRLRGGVNITNAMIPIGRATPNKAILTIDWAFPGALMGGFIVSALGGTAYNVRLTPCCIKLGQVSRSQFTVLEGENAQIHGIFGTDSPGVKNSNLTRVDRMKGTKCGSGNTIAGMSHTGTVGGLTQYGAVSSTGQHTRISLSLFADLPPAALEDYKNGASDKPPSYVAGSSPVFIQFTSGTMNGRIHHVTHVDYPGAAIIVYPRVHTTVTAGDTFRWIFGAGVCLSGADTNIWDISQMETSLCGIGYAANAFYNAHIGQLHADANHIVWQVGGNTGNSSQCNYIGQAYVEGCPIHMLTSSINAHGFIAISNDLDPALFITTTNPVDAAGALLTTYDPQQRIHYKPAVDNNPNGFNVDGLQIIGPRNTGWAADTGTAKKTAHATYAAGATLTFGATYTQAELTALATRLAAVEAALQNTSQEAKALKDLAITHGLAGT